MKWFTFGPIFKAERPSVPGLPRQLALAVPATKHAVLLGKAGVTQEELAKVPGSRQPEETKEPESEHEEDAVPGFTNLTTDRM